MTPTTPVFTLANVVAACLLFALTAYVVLGGADFGGGVWDLLASGPRRNAQRALIGHAIAPIWEANHVWLVLVVVILFTCFPPVFALLAIDLHVPLALMLIGIVLRGSAFVFRAYGSDDDTTARRWGRVFAIASVITPILLGACVGAIASGAIGAAPTDAGASFHARFIAPWLAPFPLLCGALALASFSFLAAVYLTVDASASDAPELREDFRRRALWSAAAVFVTAFAALAAARVTDVALGHTLTESGWALGLHVATAIAALVAIVALVTRRWRLARITAPAQVALIVLGWGAGQFPSIVPGGYTITDAAAPAITLRLTLIGLAGGAVVLAPSLWYLFRVFKGRSSPSPAPP